MNFRILEVDFDFEFFRSGFWVRNQDTERQELAGFVKKVFIVSIDACQSPKKSIKIELSQPQPGEATLPWFWSESNFTSMLNVSKCKKILESKAKLNQIQEIVVSVYQVVKIQRNYQNRAKPNSTQGGNLRLVLVRNAGHSVPLNQPQWALRFTIGELLTFY